MKREKLSERVVALIKINGIADSFPILSGTNAFQIGKNPTMALNGLEMK